MVFFALDMKSSKYIEIYSYSSNGSRLHTHIENNSMSDLTVAESFDLILTQ